MSNQLVDLGEGGRVGDVREQGDPRPVARQLSQATAEAPEAHCAVNPPSATISAPVTYDASSELMLTLSTVDSSSVYSCRRTKVLRDPHPPQTSPEIGKPWVVWAVHVCKGAASATGVAKPIPASPPATAITSDKGKG